MSSTVIAYIGLGSNQDHPIRQVRRALEELAQLPASRLLAQSGLYRSAPLGPSAQPDFINAVAALETGLAAPALLSALQALETAHGRVRGALRWGPRTLDLDLLLYGETVLHTPALQLPHPGLPERAFVLYPLADIAPDLVIPGHGVVRELAARCAPSGITSLGDAAHE
ncbi:MAG TPA: 2-amino-4-hydroxy-6-hydroxymethyldihydropteridine diphosphokinase [Gammaproteobacteria bacterium]|nr:2-amino-4-hydroxy-6-hydroxymethyldihydropteridine diphosphokinase [Gammaproteobacteria bacterium]